ncbi:hypothetical protein BC936DRAFT_143937, partial [Jimgerdemannia flammicorona]
PLAYNISADVYGYATAVSRNRPDTKGAHDQGYRRIANPASLCWYARVFALGHYYYLTYWPYELLTYQQSFLSAGTSVNRQVTSDGDVAACQIVWNKYVLYLNFVGDTLASLSFGGIFVQRLRSHISAARWITTNSKSNLVEQVARKSLWCLIFSLAANAVMNILKITNYIGDSSDNLTVYFQLIESTLIVEALRADEICSATSYEKASTKNGGEPHVQSNTLISVSVSAPERAYTRQSNQPVTMELVEQRSWKNEDREIYL